MKYRMVGLICGLVVMLMVTNETFAQRVGAGRGGSGGGRRGGPGPAMMGRMNALRTFDIEMIWHDLSIRMDTPGAQLMSLRIFVKNATAQKQALIEQAEKSEDWGWLKDQLENSHKQLAKELMDILSDEDMKTYEKLVKERGKRASAEMIGRFRR